MHQHISTTLKARSNAICTALDTYNIAVMELNPPWQLLDWDEVIAYAFLSNFNLLRDTQQNIH